MQKISIITINYNNKEGLEKTIKSVVSQSFKDFEYLVIDGNSEDGSKAVIAKYADKINYSVSEPDKGIYNAMNKGIKAATGEYVLFLNSGDFLISHSIINEIIEDIKNHDFIIFDIDLLKNEAIKRHNYPQKLSFETFFNGSIGHPSTFIKKQLFYEKGFYDESYSIVSDWKFFLNAFSQLGTTYKKINKSISVFSLDGVSSTNIAKVMGERNSVLEKEYPFFIKDYKKMAQMQKKITFLEYEKTKIKKSRLFNTLTKMGFFKYYT